MATFCISILLLVLITKINTDSQIKICKTPKGKNGTCTSLMLCPEIIKQMKLHHNEDGFASKMKKFHCEDEGFVDKYPIICCPISRMKNKLIPTEKVCGISNLSDEDDRIVGGSAAKLGAWPWNVALGYKTFANPGPFFDCGGSLITNHHVLTAAHCIISQEDLLYMVRIADLNLETDDDGAVYIDRRIKYMKYHEKYGRKTKENDIAILGLDKPVQFTDMVRPICLPYRPWIRYRVLENELPYAAGWGNIVNFTGPRSASLLQVQIPVLASKDCQRALTKLEVHIDERVLCAGYREGGKDTCGGDSGGPLVYRNKNRAYLVGITSYGHKCALPGYPGVFTRVTAYLDWIDKNVY